MINNVIDYKKLGMIQKVKIDEWGSYWNIYIPENVNSDTEIFVYTHGGGGYNGAIGGWHSIEKYLEQSGSDNIVVMPMTTNYWNEKDVSSDTANEMSESWASGVVDVVSDIQQYYGIENKEITTAGFSWGGLGAFKVSIENIKRNPDIDPQLIFLLDDQGTSAENTLECVLSNGGKEALLQNQSIIFTYAADGRVNPGNMNFKSQELDSYLEAGLNVIVVDCVYGGHSEINSRFFNGGMIDYVSGKVSLPTNGYTYSRAVWVKNEETGKMERQLIELDVSQIDTIDELYELFGIDYVKNDFLKLEYVDKIDRLRLLEDISICTLAGESYYVRSDSELLQQRLNSIMGKVRNSTIVQDIPNFFGGIGSDTKVPSKIPSVVQGFFGISANLMLSLNSDLNQFARVGLSLTKMDNEMEDVAQDL